jgi:hypothetical protein
MTDSYVNKEYVVRLEALVEQLEAEVTRLREAVEWAIQYLERDVFNVDEVNALIEWMIDELRRRIGANNG